MNALIAKAVTIYTFGACLTHPGPGGYTATVSDPAELLNRAVESRDATAAAP